MELSDVAKNLPPTEKLYLNDPYLRRISAEVLRVVKEKGSRYYLVLDRSLFHPLGGGQPSDSGWLIDGLKFEVKKVLESEGVLVFYGKLLEGELREGVEVVQELEWERRYYIMRLHTAGHVIDRALSDLMGKDVDTLGALHGPPKAYVEYGALIDESLLTEIEKRANDLLDDREVRAIIVSKEELSSKVYGAPNLGRLPDLEEYRIVEIEGINAIPCSGTHVRRTSEIGRIELERLETLGSGTRLYYDVKPR